MASMYCNHPDNIRAMTDAVRSRFAHDVQASNREFLEALERAIERLIRVEAGELDRAEFAAEYKSPTTA